MKHPAQVEGGFYVAPEVPGAGTEPTEQALTTINRI